MVGMRHLSTEELHSGVDVVRDSPADGGTVEQIVSRPGAGERMVLEEGVLDPAAGLRGDSWAARGSRHAPDGAAEVGRQLTIMNARAIALIAGTPERWALAGDQLYLDLDLSDGNLPAGSRLTLGTAVVEITGLPHTGCAKFRERFGVDAARFVNSPVGRELHLRGINARVVQAGTVRRGDVVRKVTAAERPSDRRDA
jgi:MOSC domain-containing protein YiiM